MKSNHYKDLLAGIAHKRLKVAGYATDSIEAYLVGQPLSDEVKPELVDKQLEEMWHSGHRRSEKPNREFKTKYTPAAVYRELAKTHKIKGFSGFDQYVLLSSGIVSNFIELSKYTFYFALSDQLPLQVKTEIPSYLQSMAIHHVSQRLLDTIDGNVPVVGATLKQLITDLGSILRNRLLKHPSEPEANRLEVIDYGTISEKDGELEKVIEEAIIWSVLHIVGSGASMRPKNAARPRNAQFIINRIYCPALGISPRTRWRVRLQLSDLVGLVDSNLRQSTYKKLMRSIGSEATLHHETSAPGQQSPLFVEPEAS